MTTRNFKCAFSLMVAISCAIASPVAYTQESSQEKKVGTETSVPVTSRRLTAADFKQENPGREARSLADWVVESGDTNRTPFVIVDKSAARVFVFDAEGHLQGAAAALLGIAIGDHIAPGVGDRELSAIPLKDRTTPAGRFEAALGRNDKGKQILWVDYDSALSMHPVINTNPKERRPQRLATPTPSDNRVSFGCINVPVPFFSDVVVRAFTSAGGIVYVLPEVRAMRSVFTAYAAERPDGSPKNAGPTVPAIRGKR